MRLGKPVGGMPVRSGAIRQGRRYTPSTQTRRERVGPGRPWLPPLLWRRPVTHLAFYGKTMGPLLLVYKVKPCHSLCLLIPTVSLPLRPLLQTLCQPPPVIPCGVLFHQASLCLTTWSKRAAFRNEATEKSLEVTVATLELRLAGRLHPPRRCPPDQLLTSTDLL